MRHMRQIGALLFALCASVASADVFFQVNFTGSPATPVAPGNPFAATVPFTWTGQLSVYVWGSGGDTSIFGMSFDIGDGVEWSVDGLGAIDPNNLFTGVTIKEPGQITAGPVHTYLQGFILGSLTTSVPLPQSAASALLVYEGFVATNQDVGGLILAHNIDVMTNLPGTTVHSSGVVETPAPGSALVLLAGVAALRRRR